MRFIHLYLLGYFVLVIGAGLALWQSGVLAAHLANLAGDRRDHRDLVWAILLAVTSTTTDQRLPRD